jgi:hypothetical protein
VQCLQDSDGGLRRVSNSLSGSFGKIMVFEEEVSDGHKPPHEIEQLQRKPRLLSKFLLAHALRCSNVLLCSTSENRPSKSFVCRFGACIRVP